jgi:hypothetical protein
LTKYKKLVRAEIRKAKFEYNKKQFSDNINNPKKLWQNINRVLYKREPSLYPDCPVLTHNGVAVSDTRQTARIFNSYFINVADSFTRNIAADLRSFNEFHAREVYQTHHNFICAPCSHDELSLAIDKLKSSSSVDFFGLSNKFVKIHKSSLVPITTSLINLYLSQGIFPQVLKTAIVTPIHKGGSSTDVNNFRPISILPIFGKLFEQIIYRRLSDHIRINNFLHPNQFGYVAKSNTEIAVTHILNDIYKSVDNKLCTSLTCIDLSKAFDCVNHSLLINKLAKLGLSLSFFNLLSSYLSGRQQAVKIDGNISTLLDIKTGTPQGGVLSGLFFIIYCNSIFNLSLNGSLFLYCDDKSLVNSAPDPHSLKAHIEEDLIKIDSWLRFHYLSPNRNKTNYVLFHNRKRFESFTINSLNISFGNEVIKRAEVVKLLGLHIDEELKFTVHIETIQKKVVPLMFAIKRIRSFIPDETALLLYNAYINSRFAYMSTVWSCAPNYAINGLEILQRKALRIVLNKDWYCSKSELYSKMIMPISVNASIACHLTIFKFMNNSLKCNVTIARASDSRTFRQKLNINLRPIASRSELGSHNLFSRGIVNYNKIPFRIRSFNSPSLFKKRIREHLFEEVVMKVYLNNHPNQNL